MLGLGVVRAAIDEHLDLVELVHPDDVAGRPRWMAAERDRRKAPGNRIRLTGQLVRPEPFTCGYGIVIPFRGTLGAPEVPNTLSIPLRV